MALEAAAKDLFMRCTARVSDEAERSVGSGFFIDSQHLLTCAHVVGAKGTAVRVRPYMGTAVMGRVADVAEGYDLAMVELLQVDEASLQPAVFLRQNFADGAFHVASYPTDKADTGGIEVRDYEGHARNRDDGTLLSIQLTGQQVTFGMSGGAVLDESTRAVVAVVRYSKDTGGIIGGGAVPVAQAATKFELVRQYLAKPPIATKPWREQLGEGRWQELGFPVNWSRQLDIRVGGAPAKWWVGLDVEGSPPQELTIRDLGEGVAEVLFQRAQRGRVRSEGEVNLLGRLLSGALFSKEIRDRLNAIRQADEVLVRLRVEGAALMDVPWELATIPGDEDRYLAAEPSCRFVRVDVDRIQDAVAPTAKSASVLGIVVQPKTFKRWPVVFENGKPADWPKSVGSDLKAALNSPSLRPTVLENPEAVKVEAALEVAIGTYDVVHYIGFGNVDGGEAQLAFSDEEGNVYFNPVKRFMDWVGQSGARLVVIEFASPPDELDLEAVPPSALLESLPKCVCAMVCTRIPVHARLLKQFNVTFYSYLAQSQTIEKAVQLARRGLKTNALFQDHAGFGWFTLMTGKVPGLRIVTQAEPTGGQQLAPLSYQMAKPAESERPQERDDFVPTR